MFNEWKNKISYNHIKRNYCNISEVDDIEEVYYAENKLVVVVNDEEISKQIYDIIITLKYKGEIISTKVFNKNLNFKVSKYIADKHNRIRMFYIDVNFEANWNELSKLQKLQEVTGLITDMESKGYILDNSKFENEKLNSISTFLSLFSLNTDDVDSSKEYLIKYIHYILSGEDLEKYYEKVVDNVITEVCNFSYTFPVIAMCYNYFAKNAKYSLEEINTILRSEELQEMIQSSEDDNYLLTSTDILKNKLTETESNDKYTIYDGNIKIYHNMSEDFKRFLKYYDKCDVRVRERINPIEKLSGIIMDFSGNIIGYKFYIEKMDCIQTIFEKDLKSQHAIFDFISEIDRACKYIMMETSKFEYNKFYYDFKIEESIICYNNKLIITKIDKVFDFINTYKDYIKYEIISIFFKIYVAFLKQKYGEMHKEEELLSKEEVRFLSPVIAKNFINYALERNQSYLDYDLTAEELFEFLYNTKSSDTYSEHLYDSRFEYNPIKTPFIFDYEAEEKYGVKIESGMNEKLADGRSIITFKRKKKISKLKNAEDTIRKEISRKFLDLEDDNIKVVGISEIIYSTTLNDDNMYKLVGYITEPIKGTKLTEERLLEFNNKELLKVFAYLFSKFSGWYANYIPLDVIWMDDNYTFYINIMDDNFKIEICTEESFPKFMIKKLVKKGYNPNSFIDLADIYSKNSLLIQSNSFDTYCKVHNIFYDSSNKMCPACSELIYSVPDDFEKTEILEDTYAKHYRIDNKYNLKVYKASCPNMKKIEKSIEGIVSRRLNKELSYGYFTKEMDSLKEVDFVQECFIPYKKAVNSNNEFIGYIYKAANFDGTTGNVCVDISDLSRLRNLPRIMRIIRLIQQVQEFTDKEFSFIQNPFTHVFLAKDYKNQVQICNIEFLGKEGSIKDTIKWTYKYVENILALDDSIVIDMPNDSSDLDSLLTRLQALAKDMTKCCKIHNMYYSNKHIFCPKCVDKKKMKDIIIEDVKLKNITSQKKDDEGGESVIYPYGNNKVAKIFREKEIDYDYKNVVLSRIFSKKDILEELNRKANKYTYVIPQKLLIDNDSHNILGYTMKKVKGMPISILRDKEQVAKLEITTKDVLEILITIGKGIEELHTKANIFIGDLNNRNILFDTQNNVYFLDFDGMGIDEIAPMFLTDGFIDPVSQKNDTVSMKDDWYSFAIQAFYYLTFTHPFNGIYYAINEESKGKEKVNMPIPERMELRISLLGNHGIKPPTIAKSWNWMDKELKDAFLNIFEGDNRESIVPYLINQYQKLYQRQPNFSGKINVNSKFVAKEINPFKGDVVRIINPYAAICFNDNYYTTILVEDENEQYDINFPNCIEIRDILLVKNTSIAIAIYPNKVIAIDLKTDLEIYSEEILGMGDVCINDTTLYCSGLSRGEENVIFQREFKPNGEVKEDKIKFLVDKQTKSFLAKFNSKFVLIKQASEYIDEIYCNSEKLCNIACNNSNTKYNTLYDTATKSWLVINSEGNACIIKASGDREYETINVPKENINDTNIGNITFDKGVIYIPNQNFLYIINVNDQLISKKMECNTIMTPNSKIYNNSAKGFSVINNGIAYEVRKR